MSTLPSEQALAAARELYVLNRDVMIAAPLIDKHTLSPEERALREAVVAAGVDGGETTSSAIDDLEAYLKAKPTLWAENKRLQEGHTSFMSTIQSLTARTKEQDEVIGSLHDIIDRKERRVAELEADEQRLRDEIRLLEHRITVLTHH